MFVGIDWATESHAICVLDDATGRDGPTAFSIAHTAPGLRAAGRPAGPPRRAGRPAGGHRTTGRPAGRPAAGGRPPGGAGHAQRHQGLARGRGGLGRQDRPRRRQGHRRVPAAARSTTCASSRRSPTRPGRCGPWSGPGRPGRCRGSPRPTSSPRAWRPSGRAPRRSSPTSEPRSPSPSWSAIRHPTAAAPPRRACAWPAFLTRARLQRAPDRRSSCSRGSAPRPRASPTAPRPRPRRDAVLAMVARDAGAQRTRSRTSTDPWPPTSGEHPDAEIFTSLPRSGQINAAQMLAEWGDCREAYAGPKRSPPSPGIAPVTRQSGKHPRSRFRWACNKRFRNAITTFADNTRHASPWAADGLRPKPSPGAATTPTPSASWPAPGSASSGAAGSTGVPYDPAKHGAANDSPSRQPLPPQLDIEGVLRPGTLCRWAAFSSQHSKWSSSSCQTGFQ